MTGAAKTSPVQPATVCLFVVEGRFAINLVYATDECLQLREIGSEQQSSCHASCIILRNVSESILLMDDLIYCAGIMCQDFFRHEVIAQRHAGKTLQITRVPWKSLDASTLLSKYLRVNIPVVITGLVETWYHTDLPFVRRNRADIHTTDPLPAEFLSIFSRNTMPWAEDGIAWSRKFIRAF